MKDHHRPSAAACVGLIALALTGCSGRQPRQASAQRPDDAYVPGLGEIMSANQMRHAKLWYAGEDRNWPLAAYEVDELREGFGDAMHFHPKHKDVPRPLTELVPEFIDPPLDALDAAIKKQDKLAFEKAFDDLTTGCNGCHQAAHFGFNVIQRPTAQLYSNQRFEPLPAPAGS